MSAQQRRLHLAVRINSTGTLGRSWSWPGTQWNRFADVDHFVRLTELARAGGFDAVFVSDHPALARAGRARPTHTFDPIVLFAALAAKVPDIGFLLTASSSYNSPYNLARRVATLDAISGGRAGWNVVSSFNPDVAANFGAAPLPPREERYRRADEFLQVVKKLWLSWDTPTGEAPAESLWDGASARPIDHHGEFFDVTGPLNVPIGPQGYPVVAQAGGSPQGIELAAKHAELIYASLLDKQTALVFGANVRGRAAGYGRGPDSIRVLPGLTVIPGATRAEAHRKHEALHDTDEDGLIAEFTARAGLTGRRIDPDKPLDPEWFPVVEDHQRPEGHRHALADFVANEEVTPRQLVRRVEGGHRLVVGTPEEIAADLLSWWEDGASDGFNLQVPILPDGITELTEQLIPVLRAAGAVAVSYEGRTLRERFGLPDPRADAGSPAAGVPA